MSNNSENINNLKVIILAAGKGKRLQSELTQIPKAMRLAAGKPLLHYVLKSVDFIENKKDIIIVAGFLKEIIIESFPEYTFAIQDDNNSLGYGTGAAVRYAEQAVGDYSGDVLILLGDTPLISRETILNLYAKHKENNSDCTVLSCGINDVLAIGRILRDEDGNFADIIENKVCSEELRQKIKEYNTGVMLFNSKKLFGQLKNLNANSQTGEFYLTDIPKLFLENNYKVGVYKSLNENEIHGANSIEELELIENILKRS